MIGRPTRAVIAAELALLAAALLGAAALAPDANWDLPLLALLIVLSVVSDLRAVETAARRVKVSGSLLAIVTGVGAAGRDAGRPDRGHHDPRQLAALALRGHRPADQPRSSTPAFPLISGAAFHFGVDAARPDAGRRQLLPPRPRALRHGARDRLRRDRRLQRLPRGLEPRARTSGARSIPILPSELAAGLLTLAVTLAYDAPRPAGRRSCSRSSCSPSSTSSASCCSRRSAATSSRCGPSSSPASRSRC